MTAGLFSRLLSRREPDEGAALSSIPPDRLLELCAAGASAAVWAEFLRRFHPLIALTVLRTARQYGDAAPTTAEDLVQDVYLKLCALDHSALSRFESRHPDAVFGYIKIFAANVVRDHFKAQSAAKRDRALALPLDEVPEPVAASTADRAILLREIDDLLRANLHGANATRDRTVFWLHFRAGLSAQSIAALPAVGLSTKGVESLLLRLTQLVRSQFAPDGRDPLANLVSESRAGK